VESVELNKNVFEINTTDKNLLSVVKSVISIIEGIKHGKIPEEFFPGKINWIEMVEMD
jgi:broad-specificity NMP kinase